MGQPIYGAIMENPMCSMIKTLVTRDSCMESHQPSRTPVVGIYKGFIDSCVFQAGPMTVNDHIIHIKIHMYPYTVYQFPVYIQDTFHKIFHIYSLVEVVLGKRTALQLAAENGHVAVPGEPNGSLRNMSAVGKQPTLLCKSVNISICMCRYTYYCYYYYYYYGDYDYYVFILL